MKIVILSASNVASWYSATLMERGHEITIGPFGHVPTAVECLIKGLMACLSWRLTMTSMRLRRDLQRRLVALYGAV
jgi:hypothetical protein